jgi:hypothetical protein
MILKTVAMRMGMTGYLVLREPVALYASLDEAVRHARGHLAAHNPEVWRTYVLRFRDGRKAGVAFSEEAEPEPRRCDCERCVLSPDRDFPA